MQLYADESTVLPYVETLARRVVSPEALFCKPTIVHLTGLEAVAASTGDKNCNCKTLVFELYDVVIVEITSTLEHVVFAPKPKLEKNSPTMEMPLMRVLAFAADGTI